MSTAVVVLAHTLTTPPELASVCDLFTFMFCSRDAYKSGGYADDLVTRDVHRSHYFCVKCTDKT